MPPPPLKPHEASAKLAGRPPADPGEGVRTYFEFEAAGEACARLVGNMLERRGIVLLTGASGTGKTLILERLASRAGLATRGAFVPGQGMDLDALRLRLARALGIPDLGSGPAHDARTVNTALVELDKESGTALLAIDDADALTDEVLACLPELAPRDPESGRFLLQIVLSGGPELTARLERPELRVLNEAVADRVALAELREDELEGFVRHRLELAGGDAREELRTGLVAELIANGERNPGRVSALCDVAGQRGFSSDEEPAAPESPPVPSDPAPPARGTDAIEGGAAVPAPETAPPVPVGVDEESDEPLLDTGAVVRNATQTALGRISEAQRVAVLAQAPRLAKLPYADAGQVAREAEAAAHAGDLEAAIACAVAARKLYAEATAQALRRAVPPALAIGGAAFLLFASFPSKLRIPALVVLLLGALIAGMPAADARRRKPPRPDDTES